MAEVAREVSAEHHHGEQAERMPSVVQVLRHSLLASLRHDVLNVAQATAYSAMVALFPMLIVAAAVLAELPDNGPLRIQMSLFFDRVLPSNVSPLLEMYFSKSRAAGMGSAHALRAVLGSLVVGIVGASGVMSTLMEGFRRAYGLPLTRGSFWLRRRRALLLVPLSLLPMTMASVLVVFGHFITHWLVGEVTPSLKISVLVIAFLLRWTIALAGSVGIIAVIYHLGTDVTIHLREHVEPLLREPWGVLRKDWSWRASLPGATVATLLWLVTTMVFGYYVTRFANYSRVYGSLGAAIALMFWLYLIALSVLIGAEFNAQRAAQGPTRRDPKVSELLWKLPGPHRRGTGRMAD